jgi:hypothetical protein
MLDDLQRTGIHIPPPILPEVVDEIIAYLKQFPMYRSHMADSSEPPLSFDEACLKFDSFAPEMKRVFAAPHWLLYALAFREVAAAYFEEPSSLYSLNCFWLMGSHELQSWHRDEDAAKQLAIMMFGTDTDESNGGHLYQAGSHLIHRDHDLPYHQFNPPPEIVRHVYGPRGTVFMIDPWGLHRALPSSKPRAMLWARYSGRGKL